MFQTKRKPVSIFTHRDEGAPELTQTAGSLKTLLKACLVSGYGSKQPLGWEMPFEQGNTAVFRSKAEDSNRHFLEVINDAAKAVDINGYLDLPTLGNGRGRFGYSRDYKKFGYISYNASRSGGWWLIGHDKAFVLILNDGYNNHCGWLYFGDVPSIVPQDNGNTVLMYNGSANDYAYHRPIQWLGLGGDINALLAKRWTQAEQQAAAALSSAAANSGSDTPYPDPISGGTMAAETYLYEWHDGKPCLRALLPGVFKLQNNLDSVADGIAVALDGVDDTLLKFKVSSYSGHHILINASAWEA